MQPPSEAAAGPGHEVLTNIRLSPTVHRLEVRAPRIAEVRAPGQFVIVRRGPGAERIALTIAGSDTAADTITLVVQAVGKSTAVLLPIATALRQRGTAVTSIVGARSRDWVLLEEELGALGTVVVCTDDGSYGRPGLVTGP